MLSAEEGRLGLFQDLMAVELADDDPEDTVMLALTTRDVACIALGLKTACRNYPWLWEQVNATAQKINEVGRYQGFFPEDDGEDD